MSIQVDWLVSDHFKILVAEGHVDLEQAGPAFAAEAEEFPPPRHGWMRYCDVPEDEDGDAEWWREECDEHDDGAEPVTLSVMNW